MKKIILLLSFFLLPLMVESKLINDNLQQQSSQLFNTQSNQNFEMPKIPAQMKSKIGSFDIYTEISKAESRKTKTETSQSGDNFIAALYFNTEPTTTQLSELNALGIECYLDTWTPPLPNHPLGFVLAKIPSQNIVAMLSLPYIQRISSTSTQQFPNNNSAAKKIRTEVPWYQGWTGTGVKVGIMDTGLDTEPLNVELPATLDKVDVSNYPAIDYDVENRLSGHGTHVTGTVLGWGVLSEGNIGNGGGAYKGMANDASLCFIKIGGDYSTSASDAVMIAGIHIGVEQCGVKLFSVSYGGWDQFMDGSDPLSQAVDWAYNEGVAYFTSAGNYSNYRRHFSGIVNANSETDFIQVNANNIYFSIPLSYNLIWFDGLNVHNDLKLKYYDSNFNEIINISDEGTIESLRGTESYYSFTNFYIPFGNSVYYLKVVNNSSNTQDFHIYDFNATGYVSFQNSDPLYTLGSAAAADHAFTIGSYVNRISYTKYDFTEYVFASPSSLDKIAGYSSRGPRIDGLQKPNISAPGYLISNRDRDVYQVPNSSWVDSDGLPGGTADYIFMTGTSMACPVVAGAAAMIFERCPDCTPQDVYDAIQYSGQTDAFTGAVPNPDWGYGKLNVYNAINYTDLPLPLSLNLLPKETCYGVPIDLGTFDDNGNPITVVGGSGNYRINWFPYSGFLNFYSQNPTFVNPTRNKRITCRAIDLTTNEIIYGYLDVIVHSNPLLRVATTHRITLGESANLATNLSVRTSAQGPLEYLWTDKNAWSSTEAEPIVSPTETTRYYLTVTDGNGCISNEARINVIVRNPRDIALDDFSDSENVMYFETYPNPAEDNISLIAEFNSNFDGTIEIMDMLGNKIFEKDYSNTSKLNENIVTSHLASGVYLIIMKVGNEVMTRKFVKK